MVCYYRNPQDVIADMVEDNSMAGQLQGRFKMDFVRDQHGANHRIFDTVCSSIWMHHWSFLLSGGNRVLVVDHKHISVGLSILFFEVILVS